MESAEKSDGRDRSSYLHGAAKRGLLLDCEVGTSAIVVVGAEDLAKMRFTQD